MLPGMFGSPSTRRFWRTALPVLVLLAVTLPHLDQGDFRTDTARYAAVGLQAWRDPACFWTLHLQPDVPYFNKPPLVFWVHGLILHWTGVNLVAARLPSVAAAAACVLLTMLIARRLMGRATALASGLVLALTYEFFRRTREISLDLWQLAFMLGAAAMAVHGVRRQRPLWLAAAGLPLGLALLCKPFMALLTLPLLAAWLGAGRLRRWAPALAAALALALAVALPWHLAMLVEHGTAFAARYFGAEIAARSLGRINAQPLWYYAAEIGRTYWPWLALLACVPAIVLHRPLPPRPRDGLRWALIWGAGWFVALSLFPDKRPRYELPLYPALALLAGYGLARIPWRMLRTGMRRALPAASLAIMAGAAVAALSPLRVQAPPDPAWTDFLGGLRAFTSARVFSAALSTNDEGYYYLANGRWPETVRRPDGSLMADLPAGSILLYTEGLLPEPGRGESLILASGPYRATRLTSPNWLPSPINH